MLGQARSCWICGEVLAAGPPEAPSVCIKPACRFAYASHPKSQLCSHCRRPLTLSQSTQGACADPVCQSAVLEARNAAREEQQRAQTREIAELVHLAAGPAAAGVPVTFLPSNTRRLVPLPEKQAMTFLRGLDKLLSQVESEGWIENRDPPPDMPAVPTDPAVLAVAGHGCAGCRGYCCQNGRTHAFVTLRTLRRIKASQPDITAGEIREAYRSKLTGEHYEDCCVFQGETGCKLSYEIRGDTCNQFFCKDLHQFFEGVAGKEAQALMTWPEDNGSYNAAWVEPAGVTQLGSFRRKAAGPD